VSAVEFESTNPAWSYDLEQGVHQLGRLYGIDGLEVATKSGIGTMCALKEDGSLLINIDPEQVIKGHGESMDSSQPTTSPEITALFMTGHEIGHASDFLDPAHKLPAEKDKARDFFDLVVDDTVIDRRSRRVPLFDANANAVYGQQISGNLSELPRHVQLMYGIRISTVIDDPQIEMDSAVREILESLKHYDREGTVFDIPAVMADPRTTLKERRKIAETFILPHYQDLLEEDEQSQQSGQDGLPSDQGSGDFQSNYDQYDKAVHGEHDHGESKDQSSPQEGQTEPGEQSTSDSLAQQIADAIKQATAKKEKGRQDAKVKAEIRAKESEADADQQLEAQLSQLAGSVAAEMNLSPGDAEKYVRSLDKWRPTIKEVAKVFMKLAAPANIIMSPRYTRGAHTEGLRLHPQTMAAVALQLAADQDQAVWQSVERKAHRQEVTFGGLDVDLMVDVSGSMRGEKAECAADTALCLIEGLQLARYMVAREAGQHHQPDVRTQVIAFGSSSEVLAPLSHEPTGEQKGKTYTNLLNPNSNSTLISGTLEKVRQHAVARPKRDVVGIIISDGHFHDHETAAEMVAAMPKSVVISHLVMGGDVGEFISDNHEVVPNPNALPGKLYGVLAEYIRRNSL
jgi:hypothetical protein